VVVRIMRRLWKPLLVGAEQAGARSGRREAHTLILRQF